MKIILNSYGFMGDKRFLKAIEGMSEFEWRTNEDVIALIEKKHKEIKYLYNLKEKGVISNSQQSKLNKLTGKYNKNWLHFRIEEVDTTRKWCILDYDSSKSIEYLELENESLNFYGFI